MPENKKHHFVPRFYLKLFSENGKSINIFNLSSRKLIIDGGLEGQCYQDYFYGKDKKMEGALSHIETEVSKFIKDIIINDKLPPFMSAERLSLLLYILVQRNRTTYSVDEFNELNDKLIKNIMKPTIKEMKLSKEEIDGIKITVKNAPQMLLGLSTQHYPLLIDLKWKLLKAAPPFEFITSDNPVVFYNQLMNFRNFGSNTGLAAKGLQIFFPISPCHLIILYDDKVYGVGSQKQKEILVDKKNDIDQLNNLQYVSAYENIYFYDNNYPALQGFLIPEKFRNHEKTSLKTLFKSENDETTNEFIATSKNDVRTNLELSFIRILKPAKEWRRIFQKQKAQPMAVARNENLLNDHKKFLKLVESKKYNVSEFFEYLNEKHNG